MNPVPEEILSNLEEEETDLDDFYELKDLIDKLKGADDPNGKVYVDFIDEVMDEAQTKLADIQDALEPLRKYLLEYKDE